MARQWPARERINSIYPRWMINLMKTLVLNPGKIILEDIKQVLEGDLQLKISNATQSHVNQCYKKFFHCLSEDNIMYGINTGFGAFSNIKINSHEMKNLQKRLILSHCTGVGEELPDDLVRLILFLKINSLSQGFSGVSWELIERLIGLVNRGIYPCIPCQGSVGASGDLGPLSYIAVVLLGEGHVMFENKKCATQELFNQFNIKPYDFKPKEGLALINGTEVSNALALSGLLGAINMFNVALVTGALTSIAIDANADAFHPSVHAVRRHRGQQKIADVIYPLLSLSSSSQNIQDPCSIRCQPQVMGACYDQLIHAKKILLDEANSVTDNPVFCLDDKRVRSAGNFHGEPVAITADLIAICLVEIGSLAERRIAMMMDDDFSGLTKFLAKEAGYYSGFMNAHTLSAALVSENKTLAHPSSIDSIPTAANQEDHVSMATYGARRLRPMANNLLYILAVEALVSVQGIGMKGQSLTGSPLDEFWQTIHERMGHYQDDHPLSDDINWARRYLENCDLDQYVPRNLWYNSC